MYSYHPMLEAAVYGDQNSQQYNALKILASAPDSELGGIASRFLGWSTLRQGKLPEDDTVRRFLFQTDWRRVLTMPETVSRLQAALGWPTTVAEAAKMDDRNPIGRKIGHPVVFPQSFRTMAAWVSDNPMRERLREMEPLGLRNATHYHPDEVRFLLDRVVEAKDTEATFRYLIYFAQEVNSVSVERYLQQHDMIEPLIALSPSMLLEFHDAGVSLASEALGYRRIQLPTATNYGHWIRGLAGARLVRKGIAVRGLGFRYHPVDAPFGEPFHFLSLEERAFETRHPSDSQVEEELKFAD